MLRRRLAALAVAALTCLGLLAIPGAARGAEPAAYVRVAHFAPGLLVGDVYIVFLNGRQQLKGVPFKTVSDYWKVEPGRVRVEVRKSRAPVDSPPAVAASAEVKAGKAYTLAVFGQLTDVKAVALEDDVSRPGTGSSKVRLIQAIPGDGTVDLTGGGDVLVSGARFRTASDYQEVPAGRLEVAIRKSGSSDNLAPARSLQLPGGAVSTLIAVGGIGQKTQLIDVRDAVATAKAPTGGVATGAGGTAPADGPPATVVAGLAACVMLAAGLLATRRRPST